MIKDFDTWNEQKKILNNKSSNRFYHSREIWWCKLGLNVGFEQDGDDSNYERPVLIIRSFSRFVCLVIPLTTSRKHNSYHINLGKIKNKDSAVIISQIRLIDTKRFSNRIGIVDTTIFANIRKAIRNLF